MRRETTPRSGALMVVYDAFSSATRSAAFACSTRASATEAAARAASICSGPAFAAASRPSDAATRPAVLAAEASTPERRARASATSATA